MSTFGTYCSWVIMVRSIVRLEFVARTRGRRSRVTTRRNRNPGVGKTTLIQSWKKNKFVENVGATVGIEQVSKIIYLKKGIKMKLRVWDTIGQERFGTITKSVFKNAEGILLCFDRSNPESLKNLKMWKREVLHKSSMKLKVLMIVGCKDDLKDVPALEDVCIPSETIRETSESLGYDVVLTSAKAYTDVDEPFRAMATKMLEGIMETNNASRTTSKPTRSGEKVTLSSSQATRRGKCC